MTKKKTTSKGASSLAEKIAELKEAEYKPLYFRPYIHRELQKAFDDLTEAEQTLLSAKIMLKSVGHRLGFTIDSFGE